MQNLGLVGVKSSHNRYLQSHTNGELHASNDKRNTEETWFLVEIDAANSIYALYNWRTGNFLSKTQPNCPKADVNVLSDSEKWVFVSGHAWGIENAVMIKTAKDGILLGANAPGDNVVENCGGEVNAVVTGPVNPAPQWGGWWVLEAADKPEDGKDMWNTVGGWISAGASKLANKVDQVDVNALIAALAAKH